MTQGMPRNMAKVTGKAGALVAYYRYILNDTSGVPSEQGDKQMSNPNPEDNAALQREIQAAIAAGRELDPEMDQHLAASATERYTKEKAAREHALGIQQAQAAALPRQPNPNLELVVRSLGTAVIIGAIIAAIVFAPHFIFGFWWLIFFIWPMWGYRGRRWSRRNYYAGTYQPGQPPVLPDEDAQRRQREADRQRKIAQLEAEIKSLKKDDYV